MSDSRSHTFEDAERWARLTDKQRACLDLLIERQTSKQIARQLGIAKPTVDLRLTKARDILGTANRDETAIVYARLKQTYDRITCDPIDLPPPPTLVPSHFPDGGPADAMALNDSVLAADGPMEASPPFRDFWRHDHARTRRALIMAAMLVALVLLILSGLAIAQALTRLISG